MNDDKEAASHMCCGAETTMPEKGLSDDRHLCVHVYRH